MCLCCLLVLDLVLLYRSIYLRGIPLGGLPTIICRQEPKMILLHGLKMTTMVVDVGVLRCIFYAIQCMGPSGSGMVDSLHLMSILYVIPSSDNQLYLPKGCLQRMLVLCTMIADGGVHIRIVVIQHMCKVGVVVGRLRG